MSDPRMRSMHLESEPRREQFRTARQLLEQACGTNTILADERLLASDERLETPTIAAAPGEIVPITKTRLTCYLKDGVNVYVLRLGMNSVGRLPDNDVVIRDECVSRRHCAVVVHTDMRCELHDVASKNGTILNGAKIGGPTRLQSGDQILLCNKKLTFLMTDTDPATA